MYLLLCAQIVLKDVNMKDIESMFNIMKHFGSKYIEFVRHILNDPSIKRSNKQSIIQTCVNFVCSKKNYKYTRAKGQIVIQNQCSFNIYEFIAIIFDNIKLILISEKFKTNPILWRALVSIDMKSYKITTLSHYVSKNYNNNHILHLIKERLKTNNTNIKGALDMFETIIQQDFNDKDIKLFINCISDGTLKVKVSIVNRLIDMSQSIPKVGLYSLIFT